jgi:hypothetical protein
LSPLIEIEMPWSRPPAIYTQTSGTTFDEANSDPW